MFTSRPPIKGFTSSENDRLVSWLQGSGLYVGQFSKSEDSSSEILLTEKSINLEENLQKVDFSLTKPTSLWVSNSRSIFKVDASRNELRKMFRVETTSLGLVPTPYEDSLITFDTTGAVKRINEVGKITNIGFLPEPATAIAHHPTRDVLFIGNHFGEIYLNQAKDLFELGKITLSGPIEQITLSADGTKLIVLHGGKISAWAIGINDLKNVASQL